ncbi:hypothetical protein L204_103040 [Cryptococcus depauperatus]|nr:hypothetical protein L204_00211 [Cryptococcus depauperatus CBS 7855]
MRFTSILAAALPMVGFVFAAPLTLKAPVAVLEVRSNNASGSDYTKTLTTLDDTIKSLALTVNSTEDEISSVLNQVLEAISSARAKVPVAKRDLSAEDRLVARQASNQVTGLMGTVVEDLNTLIAPLEGVLSKVPVAGSLVNKINAATTQLVGTLDKVVGDVANPLVGSLKSLGVDLNPLLGGLLSNLS